MDGYDFCVLALDRYCDEEREFPERVYLIGFNDEAYKMAYLYFYDRDLDTLIYLEDINETQACSWFLRNDCGRGVIK